ncbi:hypothetical protein FOA52_001483 [Chlamydomonas sp. UWO 241]|nr:hypothetical protein FOA52_001483 [Chlamydomonas sp. UWO 241]
MAQAFSKSITSLGPLAKLQASLPDLPERQALLLLCECGAEYLCVNGPERMQLVGDKTECAARKKHNRDVAQVLVANGVHSVVVPGMVVSRRWPPLVLTQEHRQHREA